LAAMLTLASIGMPLVDGLLGRPLAALGTVLLAGDVQNESGQTRLVTFTLHADGAAPTSRQGSGMLRGLAASDGVAVIPPGGASAGSRVETVPLPW
ncbi:MAG: molybdopterin molybdenumtransferase MoeA, partial [Microbacteriaceae bacterium]|nr:molybdopterin molybdenumtransferase MoeA [Microbacteriaceae bacterium]